MSDPPLPVALFPYDDKSIRPTSYYCWSYENLYERMRRLALDATPNEGHLALARLSKAKPSCLTITQNIDGERTSYHTHELSTDAGHELGTLQALHGSLFDLKCANDACAFRGRNVDRRTFNLLVCPECRLSYLRPGVTWFGERLPFDVVQQIDAWLEFHERIDMVLIVGTERTPYLHDALLRGAKVAWFDKMEGHVEDMGDPDWVVDGDASMTLPYVIDSALQVFLNTGCHNGCGGLDHEQMTSQTRSIWQTIFSCRSLVDWDLLLARVGSTSIPCPLGFFDLSLQISEVNRYLSRNPSLI
ncbi:hypothetical protein LTR56_025888 [Elasticomyces elasticus]|nr:hypothetical protein LTR56_025888 [Elasticomyces elasticus]